MWWPSQNKMNQLNCHIMMTLGTRYAQASGSKLQRVTNKMFYFPLNQCTWWKSDSTSICQLYRKDANFRLGASLPAQHSFRVVKFQKCSKNQSHICQPGKWQTGLQTSASTVAGDRQQCHLRTSCSLTKCVFIWGIQQHVLMWNA